MASVPHMKRATRRAEVYARSEIEAILTAPRQPRDRALLMTVYGCGLRISEATQLKTSDIDRARMQLRVRNGKGVKGRVLPLSERLLQELENYTRAQRSVCHLIGLSNDFADVGRRCAIVGCVAHLSAAPSGQQFAASGLVKQAKEHQRPVGLVCLRGSLPTATKSAS